MPCSRRSALRLGALFAATGAQLLSACGGNDVVAVIPGGGGTGVLPPPAPTPATPGPAGATGANSLINFGVFGAVTALSPLTVAGVAWQVPTTANIQLDDPDASRIELGMLVRVLGTQSPDGQAVAADLVARTALRGAIERVSNGLFFVGATGVQHTQTTQSFRPGERVCVYGHLLPSPTADPFAGQDSAVLATRVTTVVNEPASERSSGVARTEPCNSCAPQGFRINGVAFRTDPSTLSAGLTLPLKNASLVHVRHDAAGGPAPKPALQVSAHLASLPDDIGVRLEGHVYQHPDGSLRLNDVVLVGDAATPFLAQLVRARGQHRNGQLILQDIKAL